MRLVIFGFLCRDKNILPSGESSEIVGGKGLFDAAAAARSGADVDLITWLPEADHELVHSLDDYGITTHIIPMKTGTVNTNEHHGDVTIATTTLDPEPVTLAHLTPEMKAVIEAADAILMAPDIEEKISLDVYAYLAAQEASISADIGKYYRTLQPDGQLVPRWPWPQQAEFLKYIDTIFVSEEDIAVPLSSGESMLSLARAFSEQGPHEVVITQGSRGAFIYRTDTNEGHEIGAFVPRKIVDPTGAGDTFITAYVVARKASDNPEQAGRFAAMAASLKLNYPGPLRETAEEIDREIEERDKQ